MMDINIAMPHKYNLRSGSNGEVNPKEYTRLLNQLFPSKYMKKKVDDLSDSDSESTDSSASESNESDPIQVNITFTLGREEEEEEEEEEEDEEYDDEVDDSSYESDDSDLFGSEPMEDPTKDSELIKKLKDIGVSLSEEYKDSSLFKEFIKKHTELSEKHERKKKKFDKQERDINFKQFDKLMDNKPPNETKYFKGLPVEEQKVILDKLIALRELDKHEKPTRVKIIESSIPDEYKVIALQKMNQMKVGSDGETGKIKAWLDGFMKIPFGKYTTLPVTMTDGPEKCQAFMESAKKRLDDCTYGLNDAKMQIMQYLGQIISNPQGIGTVIAIEGPMGTGKTTLVLEGICKILGRPYELIPLGGATDSSVFEGHMITYEGSVWGCIANALMKAKTMDPLFFFDELDKVSDTPKGDEINGVLTHLTDSTQNKSFQDKYFAGIDLDLSRAVFVFSYNDRSKVNRILADRMYTIRTEGYTNAQKSIISKQYLSPSLRNNLRFNDTDVLITDESIQYIIANYTMEEKGVRNLKRCIETIYSKLNLFRLMTPGTNLFETEISLKVEFPFKVTPDIVSKLLKSPERSMSASHMYL
jgi:ATP-dependent Lon protease